MGSEMCIRDRAETILQLSPDVAIIEQTNGQLNINGGKAATILMDKLSTDYVTHSADIPVWKYGDVSHRSRFIIVAINKARQQIRTSFQKQHMTTQGIQLQQTLQYKTRKYLRNTGFMGSQMKSTIGGSQTIERYTI